MNKKGRPFRDEAPRSTQTRCARVSVHSRIALRRSADDDPAARGPKPRSVKFRPRRVLRPIPSWSRQRTRLASTPPWRIKPSASSPSSFRGRAVATAVGRPKVFRRPRATLYSPPPSHTRKLRALRTRSSPGSRRSMTSPSARQSQRRSLAGGMDQSSARITGRRIRTGRDRSPRPSGDNPRHWGAAGRRGRFRARRPAAGPDPAQRRRNRSPRRRRGRRG